MRNFDKNLEQKLTLKSIWVRRKGNLKKKLNQTKIF